MRLLLIVLFYFAQRKLVVTRFLKLKVSWNFVRKIPRGRNLSPIDRSSFQVALIAN